MDKAPLEHEQRILVPELYIPTGVNVHIHFSAHSTRSDIGDVGAVTQLARNADIVLIEELNWDKDFEKIANKISRGDYITFKRYALDLDEEQFGFLKVAMRAIYNSRAFISSVDLGKGHPLNPIISGYSGSDKPHAVAKTFKDHIVETDEKVLLFAQANMLREEHMLSVIGPKIDQIVANTPKLKDKTQIQVLMTLGTMHTNVYHQLKKWCNLHGETNKITRTFGEDEVVFAYDKQVIRAELSGRPLPTEHRLELLARNKVAKFIAGMIEDPTLTEMLGISPVDWQKRYRINSVFRSLIGNVAIEKVLEYGQALTDIAVNGKRELPDELHDLAITAANAYKVIGSSGTL
jgi:hypothetical protein